MSKPTNDNNFRTPWDTILGTKSQVRVLRVLEETRESMAVRELARRAGEHLRSVQLAVDRLVRAGIIVHVGSGSQQLVQLSEVHPLTKALEQLFEAERARFERIVDELKSISKKHAARATAVWLNDGEPSIQSDLEVGLLAPSSETDGLIDALREPVARLSQREDVSIEIRGWTRPDLEVLDWSPLPSDRQPILLWGVLPTRSTGSGQQSSRRSHLEADETLLEHGKLAAAALKRRPELVRKAGDEIEKRLKTARPQEAKTLREWQELLENMSVPQLRRWLVGHSERATRLRQSMPFVFFQAAEEHSPLRQGKS